MEKGKIIDFFMERRGKYPESAVRVGNIYKGRVLKVLPGISAAFVDVGYEQAAYLYLEKDRRASPVGSGEGGMVPDDFSKLCELSPVGAGIVANKPLMREGDLVLVQVSRESIGTKGPKLTRDIALSGRRLVYMPLERHIGVSRRIASIKERERLDTILRDFCSPEGVGGIARTCSVGASVSVLKAEFNHLELQWKNIWNRYSAVSAPGLCHEEIGFTQRILRDFVDEDLKDIYVDTPEQRGVVERYVDGVLPQLVGKCKLYREEMPLFKKFGIEQEMERCLANKIYLRSGGVINIDQTEALVAIDVNTGRFVGKKSLEQTVLKINLESVEEIARQLRLRNCGGIIVIDFIDMNKGKHREKVFQTLLEALQKDRVKYSIMPISGLGLVEMTRKQTTETLVRVVCDPCPCCNGGGRVKSVDSICYELLRDLQEALKKRRERDGRVFIHAHSDVVDRLCDREKFGFMDMLEKSWGRSFVVRSDGDYRMEQYNIAFEDL